MNIHLDDLPVTALVPIKTRGAGKTRLAQHLSPNKRLQLVRDMLNHVLNCLQQIPAIERVVVLSPERDQLAADVEVMADAGWDLNSSLTLAVTQLRHQGAGRILIVPADLAMLQVDDVQALLSAAKGHPLVIAPSADEQGTNALMLPAPNGQLPFRFRFGENSYRAHQREAKRLQLDYRCIKRAGLGFDVDTGGDLQHLPTSASKPIDEPVDFSASWLLAQPLTELMQRAELMTSAHHGRQVTYSRKVFIPLTQLCRDVCHYCTFAKAPKHLTKPYLSIDEAVAIAKAGQQAGCTEALFTLGDKPEARYRSAQEALSDMGFSTTLDYLYAAAKAVFEETGLLPHLNPGLMTRAEMQRLREVSVSMGVMLETTAERLSHKGGPHYGSPDKDPAKRLEVLRLAGELQIPFTTGLLIGIGETRAERIHSLLAIRDLHQRYGHIQEVIIQNFRAKGDIRMADTPDLPLEEHLWTIAVARLVLGAEMTIQAPPNLQPGVLVDLLAAGVNDWGGVSPVTPDHVNPERPWPHLDTLADETAAAGRQLLPRLPIGPSYVLDSYELDNYALNSDVLDSDTSGGTKWLDKAMHTGVLRSSDAQGLAREDHWHAGSATTPPPQAASWVAPPQVHRFTDLSRILDHAGQGVELCERDLMALFAVRDDALKTVLQAADQQRRDTVGDRVTYVVNRNINYTNICSYRCSFCAFAKGQGAKARQLRGPAYLLDLDDIAERTQQARDMGATEVCLQGGIHPQFTGDTYLSIVKAVKDAVPDMHVHAFSPLEIHHGAETLGLPLAEYLLRLKEAGLSTLPGTAAEVLHDDVRQQICPDKLTAERWLDIVAEAHRQGLKTTSTIMFGHVDQPQHWASHLLKLRRLQAETGGITEFVPLPYVHMEAPMWRRGQSRSGPTFREAVLMHAVSRLALYPLINNIQTSWVKMGSKGAALCLQAGANDLGGTLINESITRAAGGVNGQILDAQDIHRIAASIHRPCQRRNTLYDLMSDGSELMSGSPSQRLLAVEL